MKRIYNAATFAVDRMFVLQSASTLLLAFISLLNVVAADLEADGSDVDFEVDHSAVDFETDSTAADLEADTVNDMQVLTTPPHHQRTQALLCSTDSTSRALWHTSQVSLCSMHPDTHTARPNSRCDSPL
ncbi:unnamed protein product [Mortierella alpina]